MAGVSHKDDTPITGKEQLVAYIASGCKPESEWRIGTEHEKFAYDPDTLMPLPYEGPKGIHALLEAGIGCWMPPP